MSSFSMKAFTVVCALALLSVGFPTAKAQGYPGATTIVFSLTWDNLDCATLNPDLLAQAVASIEAALTANDAVISVEIFTSCSSVTITVVITVDPNASQQDLVTLDVLLTSPAALLGDDLLAVLGTPVIERDNVPTPAPTAGPTDSPTTSAPFVCIAGPNQFCCQTDADCGPEITGQFGLFCNLGNFLCNAGPAPPTTSPPTTSPPTTSPPTTSPPTTSPPTGAPPTAPPTTCIALPGQFCCATDDDCSPANTGQFGLFCNLGNFLCNAGPAPPTTSPPTSSPPTTSPPTTSPPTNTIPDCDPLPDQFCCDDDADCAYSITGQVGLACNPDNDLCYVP